MPVHVKSGTIDNSFKCRAFDMSVEIMTTLFPSTPEPWVDLFVQAGWIGSTGPFQPLSPGQAHWNASCFCNMDRHDK